MSKGLKTLLIILIILVFGAIGYFLFLGDGFSTNPLSGSLQTSSGEPVSGLATQSTEAVDADQIGQEFLAQLLNIRKIRLRDDIFSSPAFISLVDFTLELVQTGNEGRINPFAPFGIDYLIDETMLSEEEMEMMNSEEGGVNLDDLEFSPVIPASATPTQEVIINI